MSGRNYIEQMDCNIWISEDFDSLQNTGVNRGF